MRRMRWLVFALLVAILYFIPAKAEQQDLDTQVTSYLKRPLGKSKKACSDCHTGEASEKGFQIFLGNGKLNPGINWSKVYDRVDGHTMPPEAKRNPQAVMPDEGVKLLHQKMVGSTTNKPPPTPAAKNRNKFGSPQLPLKLYNHNDAVVAAGADISLLAKLLSPQALYYYRYISLHNIPPEKRVDYYNAVSFLINSLSHYKDIIRPAFGGPDNILIRINLLDYGISPEAFARLAKNDPYFHQLIVKTDVITKGRTNIRTEWVKTGERYQENGQWFWKQELREVSDPIVEIVKTKQQAAAAWLNPNASAALIGIAQTSFPIVRADWFIANASVEPAYSDLLNIRSLNDYKDLVLFDKRAAITESKATVVKSGFDGLCPRVAINNRILARRNTALGYFHETFDFKTSIGKQNVINNFLNKKRDAAEYIASLPNRLQVYSITDGNDKMLKAGDINIVIDTTALDGQVRNGRSCIVCHSKGINPYTSNYQKQIGFRADQSDLGIYDPDPKKALILAKELRDVFGSPNFDLIIEEDNRLYSRAVEAANGLDAQTNARNFGYIWNAYVEQLITLDDLQYEIGLTKSQIELLLPLRLNGVSDGVLVQALLKPPVAFRRDQFEESFQTIGLLSTLKPR